MGLNISDTGLTDNDTTDSPAAPASVWASITNSLDFTASWSAATGADSYRIDVSTNAEFGGGGGAGGLFISEVTDPGDQYTGRYVELYNATGSDIDFDSETWYLTAQANGSWSWDLQLTGVATNGKTFVVASSAANYPTYYGSEANQYYGSMSGNGDDGYFLYSGGDHTAGTLVDAYGEIGVDGTGEDWEYLDTHAERNSDINTPATTWTASEWTIPASADMADMTPNAHTAPAAGEPNYVSGYSNRTVAAGTSVSVTGLTVPRSITSGCGRWGWRRSDSVNSTTRDGDDGGEHAVHRAGGQRHAGGGGERGGRDG